MKNRNIMLIASTGTATAAGLFLLPGNPAAWVIAGVWAALSTAVLVQTARS